MGVGEGNIREHRNKLDETLACHDLTDYQVLHNLVKNQILQSSSSEFGGDVVETRTRDLSILLNMLRSASSTNMARSKPGDTSDRPWNIKNDTDEFRVMYREGPVGTPFHELLVEGFVDGPIDVLLCISWESVLYKEWWPNSLVPPFRVLSSDCIKRVRVGEQVALVRMKLPWPLSDREALVHYFALEHFENELMLPDSKTADGSAYGFTWEGIPEAEGARRIDVVGGLAHVKIDENRSYFRTIARMDVKLDWIPPSLMNFVSRQLVSSGFKLFKKEVESVSKGNEKFSKYLNDPLYKRIRKALYSKDDPAVVSESGVFKLVNEISEVEEIHASPDNSMAESAVSPQVKQALQTLDMVISVLREHRRRGVAGFDSSPVNGSGSQETETRITSGKTHLIPSSPSTPTNRDSSPLRRETAAQNGGGNTSSKPKNNKPLLAAFLPWRFRSRAG